jgi:hypothetical protein
MPIYGRKSIEIPVKKIPSAKIAARTVLTDGEAVTGVKPLCAQSLLFRLLCYTYDFLLDQAPDAKDARLQVRKIRG